MPRARNIKPGFFKNDSLGECVPLARILFVGLWCEADRAGRLEDRPKRLKAEYLPYDECDIAALLAQLEERGFIVRYSVGDQAFIAIPTFSKHQNPHVREPASTIPEPASTGQAPGKHRASTSPARLIPDSGFRIPDSIQEQKRASPPAQPQRGTRLPADWQPAPELLAWARKTRPDLDPVAQAEAFRDYWHAKPGKDGRKVDWVATWRNWIRNGRAIARPPPSVPRVGGSPEKPPEDPAIAAAKHAAYLRALKPDGDRI